jgi:hypothetical protein
MEERETGAQPTALLVSSWQLATLGQHARETLGGAQGGHTGGMTTCEAEAASELKMPMASVRWGNICPRRWVDKDTTGVHEQGWC